MFDKLYETKRHGRSRQTDIGSLMAMRDLGLTRFATDKQSDKVTQAIRLDKGDGDALNVPGTPTLYINGLFLTKRLITMRSKSD